MESLSGYGLGSTLLQVPAFNCLIKLILNIYVYIFIYILGDSKELQNSSTVGRESQLDNNAQFTILNPCLFWTMSDEARRKGGWDKRNSSSLSNA